MPINRNMFKRRPVQEETPWNFEFEYNPSTKSKRVTRKPAPVFTKEDLAQIALLEAQGMPIPLRIASS